MPRRAVFNLRKNQNTILYQGLAVMGAISEEYQFICDISKLGLVSNLGEDSSAMKYHCVSWRPLERQRKQMPFSRTKKRPRKATKAKLYGLNFSLQFDESGLTVPCCRFQYSLQSTKPSVCFWQTLRVFHSLLMQNLQSALHQFTPSFLLT